MISEDALNNFQRRVATAFKSGMEHFPHFTLHGEEHLRELDRLTKMVADAVPCLKERPERVNLLRLAVIIHDFAMVDVPDPQREEELRSRMSAHDSFADVVRKVHQDEIERVLTKEGRFPWPMVLGIGGQELEDACTVAKHHRDHPLKEAPEHLRELCALMRVIDELDIGPERAPLETYGALRSRMDAISKFHWLKHICTRRVEMNTTFSVEQIREEFRVLKVCVAVKATDRTWKAIQEDVARRLGRCVEREQVNNVLRERVQVEFQVMAAPHSLCGATAFLDPDVRTDLDELADAGLVGVGEPMRRRPARRQSSGRAEIRESGRSAMKAMEARSGQRLKMAPAVPESSEQEFKIVAIPPETLAEVLCKSGRLTVVGNAYIAPQLDHIGGIEGAASRIYVGPADCGKTRAALEWILHLTGDFPARWVVLRTDIGTIPRNPRLIVLDKSAYQERACPLPQKAVLFLDDLPTNLPALGSTLSATDAVHGLFRWFSETPYFHKHVVVATIRNEDMHARPDWPKVLPSLGEELELLRPQPLEEEAYLQLWRGMATGMISRSATQGVQRFGMEVGDDFVDRVAEREADPEAVATFIRQEAVKRTASLTTEDAGRFAQSAVETWLNETWPVIERSYGIAARVFFTLARFLEANRRPSGPFRTSLFPSWEYHKAFGPDLCEEQGAEGAEYLEIVGRLAADGHASGESGDWIWPRFDYVLQAECLPGVELELPPWEWFLERCHAMEEEQRADLARHLAAAGIRVENAPADDVHWHLGWARGLELLAETQDDAGARAEAIEQQIATLRRAVEADPDNAWPWDSLGTVIGKKADAEADAERKAALRDEQIQTYRRAVEAEPDSAWRWSSLGFAIGQRADAEEHPERKAALRDQQIQTYRRALEAEPDSAWGSSSLGFAIGQKADAEQDPARKTALREEQIQTHRRAVEADPDEPWGWSCLGFAIGQKADDERNVQRKAALRKEQVQCYRRALEAESDDAWAWNDLGTAIGENADAEQDPERKAALREEEIQSHRRAVDADADNVWAWDDLGVAIGKKADAEQDPERKAALREEEGQSHRRAVEADPDDAWAWFNLAFAIGEKADAEEDPERKAALTEEEIQTYRQGLEMDPSDPTGWDNLCYALNKLWRMGRGTSLLSEAVEAGRSARRLGNYPYNLACALALTGETQEALAALQAALQSGDIGAEHVKGDADWDELRDDPRFVEILDRFAQ